ncbi:MAG: SDR family oxidoreductase [Planctomycetales bacterium]|nr:SDR family oxidoreductase [Planctomycetales bacterium]
MAIALVTGGAGFIGSHLAEALCESGHQVRVLDNLASGNLQNLEAIRSEIQFFQGSVADPEIVAQAIKGAELVFHQAALASVPASVDNPVASHEACATGTVVVLDAARRAGVKRVVFAASSSCYGDQPTLAKRESDPLAPLSPYAAAKIASEFYLRAFHETYGLETVGLRYFNVFGPRQDPDSPYSAVIPIFMTRMLEGKSPIVYGDGQQSRDFTFVANVVQANILASSVPGVGGRIFNIANGASTTLMTLIDELNRLLEISIPAEHAPPRIGDVKDSMADITLARRDLGYDPRIDFRQGLERSIDYYKWLVKQRAAVKA